MTKVDNFLLAALAVLVTAAAVIDKENVAASHYTWDFRNGAARIQTIALLPPDVRVTIVRAGGRKPREAETARVENIATNVTRRRLEQAGYDVVGLTSDQLAENPRLWGLTRLAERHFEREFQALLQDPRRLEQRTLNIGAAAVRLADQLGVDALAFQKIDAEGAAGSQLVRALSLGSSRGYVRMDLAVVHGTTGDIEGWFSGRTRGVKAFRLTNYPEKVVTKTARLAYRRLPLAFEGEPEERDERPFMAGAEASSADDAASLD
ncbi:hypothetical protein BH24PSE2_BH24PSE2_07400 [soil metagenome]